MSSLSIDSAISSVIEAKEAAVKTQVAFAIAARKLDSQRAQGAAANQLLEAAVSLSKSLATGRRFDATA